MCLAQGPQRSDAEEDVWMNRYADEWMNKYMDEYLVDGWISGWVDG